MFVIVKMMEGELSDSLLADINMFPVFLSYFLPHTFSKETLKHKQVNYCCIAYSDITYSNCWSSHYDAVLFTPCKVILPTTDPLQLTAGLPDIPVSAR